MSGSGTRLRPRYGRIAAFLAATSTTLVSLVGALVAGDTDGPAAPRVSGIALSGAQPSASTSASTSAATSAASAALLAAPSTAVRASLSVGLATSSTTPPTSGRAPTAAPDERAVVPGGSGTGRRVVFSESQQRVWLVDDAEEVVRSYLVSGSVYDNLDPGAYEVFSRSRTAVGVDGSDLRYMVRFTHGDNAAIGFHSIPRIDGERVQTRAELGTPLSHGCVRQALRDAQALWRFAPVGTAVVVTR